MSIAVPTHVASTAAVKRSGAVSGTNSAHTTIVARPAAADRAPPRINRGESASAAPTSKLRPLVTDEKYAKSREAPASSAVNKRLPTLPATTSDQSTSRGRAHFAATKRNNATQ